MKKWRKQLKRIVAFVLMVILVGTNGNMTVLAAEEVSGGDANFTEVGTEAELHAAIENGENVKLTADIALAENIYISDPLIFDLNGQTISGPANDISVYVDATDVIFRDSSVEQTGSIQDGGRAMHIYRGRECIIESGSYGGAATITNEGTVVINGGRVYSDGTFQTTIHNQGTAIVNGGQIYAGDSSALFTYEGARTTIIDCEFLPQMNTDTEPTEGDVCYGGGTLVFGGTDLPEISLYNGSGNDVSVGSVEDAVAEIQIPTATHRLADSNGNSVATLSDGNLYYLEKIPPQALWGTSATDSNLTEGDLSEALSAVASDSSIQYIKLMNSLNGVQHTISGGAFTLDLNGKTVTGAENATVFTVTGSGTAVSFTDSSANEAGEIVAVGTDEDSAAVLVKDGASVVVEKGSYTGEYASLAVTENGSATVKGGAFGSTLVYSGGVLNLSDVTESGYTVSFLAVPGENQISIPDGYKWFDVEDGIDNEINAGDMLVLGEKVMVSFEANGGSGIMTAVNAVKGNYWLPDCAFVAPDGLEFLGWATSAGGKAINGDSPIELTGDITLYAIWGKLYDLYVGGVGMEDGDYLACGAAEVSDAQPDTGGYAYYKDGMLTLKDYVYAGEGYWYEVELDWEYSCVLYSKNDLKLKLEGENKLTNTETDCDGIVMEGNLTISGTGSLELFADYYGIWNESVYDEETDDYVGGSVVLESGTVCIETDVNGIYVKGNVTVNNGSLSVDAEEEGICAVGEIVVNGGYVDIAAYTNAMLSYGGISFKEDAVELFVPDGGNIFAGETRYYIVDASGNSVSKIMIVPKMTHTWATEYDYNHEAHWHACMDVDCFLTGNSSLYASVDGSAYGEHDADNENGSCSVCGYNTSKEIEVYVGGVGLADGEYLNSSGKISTIQPTDGGYAYYKAGVLILNNYEYIGIGYPMSTVYSELEELEIVLQGENQLKNTEADCDGIAVHGGNLTISGMGSLKIAADYGIYAYGAYDDGGELMSGGNVSINSGTITVDAGDDGIACDGDLEVKGGNITIVAYDDGIYLDGKLVMNAGTLDITSEGDDGIDVYGEEDIIINGGSVAIYTDDKGIDSNGSLVIADATLNIISDTDDCVDVDGGITIRSGVITLKSDDDGLRADEEILIEGGIITADVGDYGIFSYADLKINGGVITLTSDLDTVSEGKPAIKVCGEMTLGESMKIQKPEGGRIDTLQEATDTADDYEEYQIVVDEAGEAATFVVIKEKTSEESAEERVQAFVKRMYTVALGRDAEEEGCEWWTRALLNGECDGAGLAYGFLLGDEFKAKGYSDEEYVAVLYDTFFNREVAEGEGDFWINGLAAGVSRESVLSGFVNSEEFFNLCGEYGILRGTMLEDGTAINSGIGKFAERLYTEVLGRAGEEGGMEYWAMAISNGDCTPKDAAMSFFTSDEYLAKNTDNTAYLEALYRTFMGRDSDEAGMSFWLGAMANGTDRATALSDFADSEEFVKIMAGYGLG